MVAETSKPVFYPILGKVLGINIKSVTGLDEFIIEEFSEKEEILPNKITGLSEKHVYHKGMVERPDPKTQIIFNNPVLQQNRITVHIRRDWENNQLPWIAAGRFRENAPFGFSLQTDEYPNGQNFLNLVYESEEKPAGFEPLYLKIQTSDKKTKEVKTQYLKITLQNLENRDGSKPFLVTAFEVPESQAPEHLQKISYTKLQPKEDLVSASLKKRLFKR